MIELKATTETYELVEDFAGKKKGEKFVYVRGTGEAKWHYKGAWVTLPAGSELLRRFYPPPTFGGRPASVYPTTLDYTVLLGGKAYSWSSLKWLIEGLTCVSSVHADTLYIKTLGMADLNKALATIGIGDAVGSLAELHGIRDYIRRLIEDETGNNTKEGS